MLCCHHFLMKQTVQPSAAITLAAILNAPGRSETFTSASCSWAATSTSTSCPGLSDGGKSDAPGAC